MRYSARSLTDITRPIPLTIGRVGASRLTTWWNRTFRTWSPRPISTPQMLAIQAAGGDPMRFAVTMVAVLRAIFGWRWWWRFTGDPVRLIFAIPDDALRGKVLGRYVTLPDGDAVPDDDPIAAIRAAQRAAVHGDKAQQKGALSLAYAALTVRCALGESWYYHPQRWRTSDGYAPFAETWLAYMGLQAMDARRRLEIADGMALAHAKDPRRVHKQLQEQAYPSEMVH